MQRTLLKVHLLRLRVTSELSVCCGPKLSRLGSRGKRLLAELER